MPYEEIETLLQAAQLLRVQGLWTSAADDNEDTATATAVASSVASSLPTAAAAPPVTSSPRPPPSATPTPVSKRIEKSLSAISEVDRANMSGNCVSKSILETRQRFETLKSTVGAGQAVESPPVQSTKDEALPPKVRLLYKTLLTNILN